MNESQPLDFSLNKIRFEPWPDRFLKTLAYGQFSFAISIKKSTPVLITPISLWASFTDSAGTKWDYCGFETISNEKTWRAELLFQSSHLKDSADLLIEHGKLSVFLSGDSGIHAQHFDIFHDGLFGDLTNIKVAN